VCAATVLRGNVLRSLATAKGPVAGRLPASSGEALARMRADVAVLVDFVDAFIPIAGSLLFALGALAIMARISWPITLVLVVPILTIGALATAASSTIRRLQQRVQASAADVTAFVGELFHGLLAITTAGVEVEAIARLRARNAPRRDAAVRNRLATDLLNTATSASVELAIGLVLLLSARSMHDGTFTVGDLALFTTYVGWLAGLPRMIGSQLYQVPQAIVATERLKALLVPQAPAVDLTRESRVWFDGSELPPPRAPAPNVTPFERLDITGLTVRLHADATAVEGVDLTVQRGTLTVLTGGVGAGKSTVLRAILGLIETDAGEIRWNGIRIDQDAGQLSPPRTAFASQTGRLMSATLRENIVAGWSDPNPERALSLAAFDDDLVDLPEGLDTHIGSGGMRLSGGQAARVVAARALAREPDVLVLDDPTSALDLDTENQFWAQLRQALNAPGAPRAVLAATHRRSALEQADHIVVLDQGQVVGTGSLTELLETCPQMRSLWADELDVEAAME
jgi:ATP-binding cassette subfamily B protein